MTPKDGYNRLMVNIMKQVAHIDKKWQSNVPFYVEVTCDDGYHKYYLEGQYSRGPLTIGLCSCQALSAYYVEKISTSGR
jgi:hypothetical protein